MHVTLPKFLEYHHCWANHFLCSLCTFCLFCSLDYWTIPCSWSTATHQLAVGFSAYFLQMCFSPSLMSLSLANFFHLPCAWRTAYLSSYTGRLQDGFLFNMSFSLRDDKIKFKGHRNLRVPIHQCLTLENVCLEDSFENTGAFLVSASPDHVC